MRTGIGGCLDMTQRNRRLAQRGTGDSTAGSGQLTRPQLPAAARWKMAIATFVGAYIVTAIAIPRELSWLPHSWSFYEINIITNIIMATAMTWAILPGMSRLLRGWLYGSHEGTPVRSRPGDQAGLLGDHTGTRHSDRPPRRRGRSHRFP
jgi:hypothetical protein